MKTFKLILAVLSLVMAMSVTSCGDRTKPEVPTDIIEFADPHLKEILVMQPGIDADGDKEISYDEAAAVTELQLGGRRLSNLGGMEHFVNLRSADFLNNDIVDIEPLCQLSMLEKLNLKDNDIIDAGSLANLHRLYWIDLSGNDNLEYVDLSGCSFEFFYFDIPCKKEVVRRYNLQRFRCPESRLQDIYDYLWSIVHIKQENFVPKDSPGFMYDNLSTKDFSMNGKLELVKKRTTGDGSSVFVIFANGFIDTDIEYGTYDRCLDGLMDYIKTDPGFSEAYERFDIYKYYYVCPQHDPYQSLMIPLADRAIIPWIEDNYLEITDTWKKEAKFGYDAAVSFCNDMIDVRDRLFATIDKLYDHPVHVIVYEWERMLSPTHLYGGKVSSGEKCSGDTQYHWWCNETPSTSFDGLTGKPIGPLGLWGIKDGVDAKEDSGSQIFRDWAYRPLDFSLYK